MPTLDAHTSNRFTKLLLIGDSKSGKTGSLVSLVAAGYRLRILDFDNLLDILKYKIKEECPNALPSVEYVSLRDERKASAGGHVIRAKAFVGALKLLDHWKYDDVDLGPPANWGPDCILVLDSLSRLCDAAYDWAEPLVPTGRSGDKDPRAIFGMAQDAVESLLAMLTGEGFETNVIVIAHVRYMELPDGTQKGFPQGVGAALSPKIPQYFPSMILYTNKGGKRTLRTTSTSLIDLANPNPSEVEAEYPIETGLAQFFEVLRGPKTDSKIKPLKRA